MKIQPFCVEKVNQKIQLNPLFSKQKHPESKNSLTIIRGIPLVQSDASDHQEVTSSMNIQQIKKKLTDYKSNKARQVLQIHKKTNRTIQSIIAQFKQIYKRQALAIISPNLINSHGRNQKCIRELGSTLPNSKQREVELQTPGFELPSAKHHEFTIDLRQFTLGQRQEHSSHVSLKQTNEDQSIVSEFQVNVREPSSRRIKDKIMNSHKNRAK